MPALPRVEAIGRGATNHVECVIDQGIDVSQATLPRRETPGAGTMFGALVQIAGQPVEGQETGELTGGDEKDGSEELGDERGGVGGV